MIKTGDVFAYAQAVMARCGGRWTVTVDDNAGTVTAVHREGATVKGVVWINTDRIAIEWEPGGGEHQILSSIGLWRARTVTPAVDSRDIERLTELVRELVTDYRDYQVMRERRRSLKAAVETLGAVTGRDEAAVTTRTDAVIVVNPHRDADADVTVRVAAGVSESEIYAHMSGSVNIALAEAIVNMIANWPPTEKGR